MNIAKLVKNKIWLWEQYCIAIPEYEYRFNPDRRWRFDIAWPEWMLAVEIEGGVFTNGAHTRGKHFISDCEKYNCATERGWSILRYTPDTFDYEQIRRIAEARDKRRSAYADGQK